MTNSEIREMTPEELGRAIEDSRRELFNLRMQMQTGQLESTARIREVRRQVARLLTEENQRVAGKQNQRLAS
jgi:large subunit ribosomal protein L29